MTPEYIDRLIILVDEIDKSAGAYFKGFDVDAEALILMGKVKYLSGYISALRPS